jgi:hypothetical protein
MRALAATDWAAVTAWAAVATAFIYVGLGIFAWRQLREARRLREEQARLTRESWEEQSRLARESQAEQARQAQELREEQARPFVIVDFDHVSALFFLVIENVGRTMARNVTIEFDKPLTTTHGGSKLDEAVLFREPIPALPPGKKIRVPFDTLPGRKQSGLPLTYEVTLRYEGPTGRRYGEGEEYRLDMGIYGVVSMGPKGLPELVGEAEKLRQELHRWTDGFSGLRVHVLNRERRNRAEFRRLTVQRAVALVKEEGFVPAARRLTRDMWDRWLDRWGFRE